MIRRLLCFLVIAGVCGCSDKKEPSQTESPVVQPQEPVIPMGTVKESRVAASEYIQLTKTWTKQLSEGRTLEVKSKQTQWVYLNPNGIEFTDRLRQPNGNWVVFECDHVADRIIDSKLVYEVESSCAPLRKIAMNFWTKNPPSSFEDTEGKIWDMRKEK